MVAEVSVGALAREMGSKRVPVGRGCHSCCTVAEPGLAVLCRKELGSLGRLLDLVAGGDSHTCGAREPVPKRPLSQIFHTMRQGDQSTKVGCAHPLKTGA